VGARALDLDLRRDLVELLPGLVALRRALHRHPELAFITGRRDAFSDDFGLFMAAAPGCLLLLGTANPDKGITEVWHRPGFDIDEDALALGAHIMALAALDLLR
jgi:metal-dependent amidase/aminoacylase/carboxypeptidase family protein